MLKNLLLKRKFHKIVSRKDSLRVKMKKRNKLNSKRRKKSVWKGKRGQLSNEILIASTLSRKSESIPDRDAAVAEVALTPNLAAEIEKRRNPKRCSLTRNLEVTAKAETTNTTANNWK